MVMCFVATCNHYSDRRMCKFFQFPKAAELRRKWITLIRRQDRDPSLYSMVCSCHFVNGEKNNLPTLCTQLKEASQLHTKVVCSKQNSAENQSFPRNTETKQKWIEAISHNRYSFRPTASAKLCSKHFLESDYSLRLGKKMLKKDAVPSLFDFCENDSPPPKRRNKTDLPFVWCESESVYKFISSVNSPVVSTLVNNIELVDSDPLSLKAKDIEVINGQSKVESIYQSDCSTRSPFSKIEFDDETHRSDFERSKVSNISNFCNHQNIIMNDETERKFNNQSPSTRLKLEILKSVNIDDEDPLLLTEGAEVTIGESKVEFTYESDSSTRTAFTDTEFDNEFCRSSSENLQECSVLKLPEDHDCYTLKKEKVEINFNNGNQSPLAKLSIDLDEDPLSLKPESTELVNGQSNSGHIYESDSSTRTAFGDTEFDDEVHRSDSGRLEECIVSDVDEEHNYHTLKNEETCMNFNNECVGGYKPKICKRYKRTYFGDFKYEELKTEEARSLWVVANAQITKQRKLIKALRCKQLRYSCRIKKLQHEVTNLKKIKQSME